MKITALVSAGRLFLSDRYGYRFYVTLQRNKKHDNQFNHTSHPLSESVLTAACPWYYTCRYYNAYVAFCREPPPFFGAKKDLLQIRNKKLLTYVTIGGNI